MTNEQKPFGFPGGEVPIVGEIVGDGEVRPTRAGNRVFSRDEMEAVFGRHPMADWKPVIRRKRR
jgi:hypothetical protein